MPVPQRLIKFKPAESLQIRLGERTGSGRDTTIKSLDYFVIKLMDSGREIGTHPLSKDKPKELDVRLLFDDPMQNFKGGIAFWDGRRPACHNHEGGDVALRRDDTGVFRPVKCDLDRCPFWLNGHGDSERVKRALVDPEKGYARAYPHLNITRDSRCMLQAYFFFELPGITKRGEVARLVTTSENSMNQMFTAMTILLAQTGGILAGIPLKLKVIMRPDLYQKNFVPTITLTAPTVDDEAFNQLVLESVKRRELSMVNWKQLQGYVSTKSLAVWTGEDADMIAEHFVLRGEQAESAAGDPAAPQTLLDPDDLFTDETVEGLCSLLDYGEAERSMLQVKFGQDVDRAIDWLKEECRKAGIKVGDETEEAEADLADALAEEEPEPEADERPLSDLEADESEHYPDEAEPDPDGLQPPANPDGTAYQPPKQPAPKSDAPAGDALFGGKF